MVMPNKSLRDSFINFMSSKNISTSFHYLPLHSSKKGVEISLLDQQDCPISQMVSDQIVRLPLFFDLKINDQDMVIDAINNWSR